MTWWQTVLFACIPVALGMIPTLVTLSVARKKAKAEVIQIQEDIMAKMAINNKANLARITELEKLDKAHEKKEYEMYGKLVELEKGVKALVEQVYKLDPTEKPVFSLEKRIIGRVAK